jgi:CRISPR/Cas system-associated exonuclease Cas4 (RecB family)
MKVNVSLTNDDITLLKNIIEDIIKIKSGDCPKVLNNNKLCKKCSFNEFCYA